MTTFVVPFPICMSNNEDAPATDELPVPEDRKSSFTDRLASSGPVAAATRLMSSFTRQPRSTNPAASGQTDEKEATSAAATAAPPPPTSSSSLSFFSLTKHILPTRNRSTSPKSKLPESRLATSSTFMTSSPSSMRNSSTTPSELNRDLASAEPVTPPIDPVLDTMNIDYNFDGTYAQLRQLAEVNCNYFAQQNTDVCRRFERLLIQIVHTVEISLPLILYLKDNFHHFDYNTEIRASGYRTLTAVHGQACLRTLETLRQVDTKRVGLLFNLMYSSRLFQDLESWTKVLTGMHHLVSFAVKMVDYAQKKTLCIDANDVPLDVELEYFKIVAFDSEHFFGRTCGFQFTPAMQTMLTFLLAGLATYHETYNRSITLAAASLATAPKYILFPEQRAKKCAAIFRDCDYQFCKSFWNLVDHDYIKMGSRYIAPSVTVSKYFQIGPDPIELGSIIVPPPTASASSEEPKERAAGNVGAGADNPTGSGSTQPKHLVNIKLLSSQIREGMSELPLLKNDLEKSHSKVAPMSDQLLMHVHGGGFIATSSSTHEVYLKPWALALEIPVVSVDYSLAPEYPFPRAIEECYYAYAWILKNASKLGWTGKTILLAGDSAGGNLITIVTMKAIEAGLRKPDALICFYTPFLLGYSMSPSRLLAIMDPLLNTGFLWRCLAAYAGVKSDEEPPQDELASKTITATTTDGQIAPVAQMHVTGESAASNQIVPGHEQASDHLRKDTYYKRLGDIVGSRQAYLLRKLRESELPNHPHMSPLRAPDEILRQFPTTYLIPCARDPFIDDNVEFARRLRALAVPHQLTVVSEWPHGYLDFGYASNELTQHNLEIINRVQSIIRQPTANDTSDLASVPTFTD